MISIFCINLFEINDLCSVFFQFLIQTNILPLRLLNIKRGFESKIGDLKPVKDDNHQFVIQKETKNLIEMLWKKYANWQKILLIKEGKTFSTLEIADILSNKDTVFIIGGPYGVDEKALIDAYPEIKKWSFGAITLPHGLAKLTLIEQLYRCTTLWTGKKYHY